MAIAGETYEVEEMYPGYNAVAELQGEQGAKVSYRFALEAEKIHAELYGRAKEAIEKGIDVDIKKVWICPVCGHTYVGDEPPEKCPVCGASREKYVGF